RDLYRSAPSAVTNCEIGPTQNAPRRAARRNFCRGRVRRVATYGQRGELSAACEPDGEERHHDERDVAHGPELGEVPERIPPEAVAAGEPSDGERRSRNAEG